MALSDCLLLVLGVSMLSHFSTGQLACARDHNEILMGRQIPLNQVTMLPNNCHYRVNIPKVCLRQNGVLATACDSIAPYVKLLDASTVEVRRHPASCLGYGVIKVTVSCSYFSDMRRDILAQVVPL